MKALLNQKMTIIGPVFAGALLLAATALLMPNRWQIADAIRRGTFALPPAAAVLPPPGTAMLMQRFTQGKALTEGELRRLLAASTATASAPLLSAMANRLAGKGAAVATDGVT